MNYSKKDIQIILQHHLNQLGQVSYADPTVHVEINRVRQDLIIHGIVQHDKINSPKSGLYYYLQPDKTESLDQAVFNNMDDLKLMILFLGLTYLSYHFGDLAISAVSVGHFIEKIQTIKKKSGKETHAYLNALLKDKMPDWANVNLDEFCSAIQRQYEQEGIGFHCYLKENFFNDIHPKKITQRSRMPLFFFLPKVFCQQHVNTCTITTQLTTIKQITSDLEQFETICFGDAFHSTRGKHPGKRTAVTKENLEAYQAQLKKLQVRYERCVAELNNEKIRTYRKKYSSHFWSTVDVISRGVRMEGFQYALWPWLKPNRIKSDFQKERLAELDKPYFEETTLLAYLQEDMTKKYFKLLTDLLLFDRAPLSRFTWGIGHALHMEMDHQGRLLLIEHKNDRPEYKVIAADAYGDMLEFHEHDTARSCLYHLLKNINRVKQVMLNYAIEHWDSLLADEMIYINAQLQALYQNEPESAKAYYALVALRTGTYDERMQRAESYFSKNEAAKKRWISEFKAARHEPQKMQQALEQAKQRTLDHLVQQQTQGFLIHLKQFIEATAWSVGVLGGETITLPDGSTKTAVPKRVAMIYRILSEHEKDAISIDDTMLKIVECANQANEQHYSFLCLNRRDKKTQDLYDHLQSPDGGVSDGYQLS